MIIFLITIIVSLTWGVLYLLYLLYTKSQPVHVETKYSFWKVTLLSHEEQESLASHSVAVDLFMRLVESKLAQQLEENQATVRVFPNGWYDLKSPNELYMQQGIIAWYTSVIAALKHLKTISQK